MSRCVIWLVKEIGMPWWDDGWHGCRHHRHRLSGRLVHLAPLQLLVNLLCLPLLSWYLNLNYIPCLRHCWPMPAIQPWPQPRTPKMCSTVVFIFAQVMDQVSAHVYTSSPLPHIKQINALTILRPSRCCFITLSSSTYLFLSLVAQSMNIKRTDDDFENGERS